MRSCLRRLLAGVCAVMLLMTSASALSVEDALGLLEERYINEIPAAAYDAKSLDELFTLIGDPYTYYMTAEEYQAFLDSVEGGDTVTGIGASINYTEEGIRLVSILPGSGAEDAGLVPGDVIVAIDGVSCVPADESHRMLVVGEAGTYVRITVRHADGSTADYTIERRQIVITNTNTTFSDGVGRIDCDSFGTETGRYFADGIEAYDDQARLWIVDLRSNSGGVTSAAVAATGAFTGAGPILYFRDRDGRYYYNLHFDNYLTEKPVIVLTNGYSASASEVFTAGIRDYRSGISVGSRTFGKGVAQTVLDQSNAPDYFSGDALKVTVYRFYSPDGLTTDKIGVFPTLLVPDAYTAGVAELLSAAEPEQNDGYFRLTLAGWQFYVDYETAMEKDPDTLSVLLSALPPSAKIELGVGQKWAAITTAMAVTLCEAGGASRWFNDVSGSDYAREINTLATYGVVRGSGNGRFQPRSTMTRAQLCAILAQALNVSSAVSAGFTDVPAGSWYAGPVNALANMGLVKGVGGRRFDPNGVVTQQEYITLMGRLAAFLNFNAYEYADSLDKAKLAADGRYAPFAAWARSGAAIMTEMMVDGSGAAVNMLYTDLAGITPKAPILREQAAATLCRLLETMGVLVY